MLVSLVLIRWPMSSRILVWNNANRALRSVMQLAQSLSILRVCIAWTSFSSQSECGLASDGGGVTAGITESGLSIDSASLLRVRRERFRSLAGPVDQQSLRTR